MCVLIAASSVIESLTATAVAARVVHSFADMYALQLPGGNEGTAREFVKKLFTNVPVLDSGARGSTTTFVQRGIGDVLIAWENEALLAAERLGKDKVEIVVPSMSILAEPPVAIVDKVVDRRGTRTAAGAYLRFLYSPEGQELTSTLERGSASAFPPPAPSPCHGSLPSVCASCGALRQFRIDCGLQAPLLRPDSDRSSRPCHDMVLQGR